MFEEPMPPWFQQLFEAYGATAFPIIGLLLIIKYLLDKDKMREQAHNTEIKEKETELKLKEAEIKILSKELLDEARGNAVLSEEVKKMLIIMEQRGRNA